MSKQETASPQLQPAQQQSSNEPIRLTLRATDPVSRARLVSELHTRHGLETGDRTGRCDVAVVAADQLNGTAIALLRHTATELGVPTVLIVDEMDDADVAVAAEYRVVAVLAWSVAIGDRLERTVRAAAASGNMPRTQVLDILGGHVRELRQEVSAEDADGCDDLSAREIDVLRLIAEGAENSEIAAKLSYSERAVKNVIHRLTSRLNLRNRPHAVAYAISAGFI